MVFDILYMLVQWIIIMLVRVPLILLGLVLVPVGLVFSRIDQTSERAFSEHNTNRTWALETLPKWLWLWSNDRDGARGDKRGWWDVNCPTGDSSDFWSMFIWLAIRNPVNNMRFVKGISCDVSKCSVECLDGNNPDVDDKVNRTGWMWLKATGPTFNYYTFYGVWPKKKDKTRALIVRVGHKIKLSHGEESYTDDVHSEDYTKRWKGFTLRISTNKDIS